MRIEHWYYALPLRLRSLFRRRRVEQDLDEELQYHLERKIEEYLAQGLTPEQSRQAALRAMDGLTQRKEECRDMRRVNVIENTRSGHPLRAARPREVSGIYGCRGAHAGAGDRRQRRGLRRFERPDPAPVQRASGGEPLRNPAQGRALSGAIVSRLYRSPRPQPQLRRPGRLLHRRRQAWTPATIHPAPGSSW